MSTEHLAKFSQFLALGKTYHNIVFPSSEIRVVTKTTNIDINSRSNEHIGRWLNVENRRTQWIVIWNPNGHWYIVRGGSICYGSGAVQTEQKLSIAVIVGYNLCQDWNIGSGQNVKLLTICVHLGLQ